MRDRSADIPSYLPGRRGLLITVLLVLVGVEVATVTAVVMSQRVRTEKALALHTRQLLNAVADRTRENALKFLLQTRNVVQLTEKLLASGLLSLERPEQLERYFLDQLALVPQMDGLYFAAPDGQFLFTRRSAGDSASAFETKIIDRPAGTRRVRRISRDEDLGEIGRESLAQDTYDPRVRPWYTQALASAHPIWTDPYVFFTAQVPGITAATRVSDDAQKLLGIAGVDVALGAISHFLAGESITASGGGAVLVHRTGEVLAYPFPGKLQILEGDRLRLARLDEVDPISAQAARLLQAASVNLATMQGSHFDSFVIDDQQGDQQIVTLFAPFSDQHQWPWLLGVYAPEKLFSGTIRAGQQQALVLAIATSIVIVLAAFTLSPALIRLLAGLQRRAMRDPLSRLMNWESFEELARRAFKQARQDRRALSVIKLDIDHFEKVNDRLGRAVGDEVIVAVARRIAQVLSASDLTARFDDEAFAVLLPGTGLTDAYGVAQRLCHAVGDAPIVTTAGAVSVTISLGVAERLPDITTFSDLQGIADYRLLEAKRRGCNQAVA